MCFSDQSAPLGKLSRKFLWWSTRGAEQLSKKKHVFLPLPHPNRKVFTPFFRFSHESSTHTSNRNSEMVFRSVVDTGWIRFFHPTPRVGPRVRNLQISTTDLKIGLLCPPIDLFDFKHACSISTSSFVLKSWTWFWNGVSSTLVPPICL